MEWWLREYNQSPAQVGAMPAWFVRRVPMIAEVRHEAERERREKS